MCDAQYCNTAEVAISGDVAFEIANMQVHRIRAQAAQMGERVKLKIEGHLPPQIMRLQPKVVAQKYAYGGISPLPKAQPISSADGTSRDVTENHYH